ncbi:MAG: LemA family protein [Candidatus Magasanikbacteria bacterium]|nr:LemA family protein [Candidatus Magasanikbacteria bacterium]
MTTAYILIAIAVLIVLWLIVTFNSLVVKRNRVEEAWSDIDVQLKRRYDLIPNILETVKGYAKHEEGTLTKIVEARNAAMQAHSQGESGDLAAQVQAENQLSQTLKSIFALSEAYPDLKANQNFLQLQDELRDTEDKIQASRRFYNGNVQTFNTALQVFPTNMFAGMLGFKERQFFALASEQERATPNVKF